MDVKPSIVYAVGLVVLVIGAALVMWGAGDAVEVGKAVTYAALGGLFGSTVVQRRAE